MQPRFQDKVVLITGGAQGIGRAAAMRFASEGARVAIVDLPGAGLKGCASAIEAAGGRALAIAADVTKPGEIERYVATTVEALGGIDHFFNNAGILGDVRPLIEYSEEMFDRVFAVNVKAVWLGMKHVAPVMIKRGGGVIVNTASIAGTRASAGLVAYTASKHAVIGMTRTGSVELARYGIRVNAVCPAPIDTPMGKQLDERFNPENPQAAHERFMARIPMGRYGSPEEVAGLVAYLCSADASYVNGGIYNIDGGSLS